jgi:DNA-binding transcriptional MerR regulator
MMSAPVPRRDPLVNLREYRQLAPWSLHDLATLAGAILEATCVRPLNAAASARPSERTIRFYVTRNLVSPPDGRGTAATYSYRHLLNVLAIKLRQMEGATLTGIERELGETSGDVLERRVAAALGENLPAPTDLPILGDDDYPRGRAGQRLRGITPMESAGDGDSASRTWQRVIVSDGIEVHVRDDHALVDRPGFEGPLAETVRMAVARMLVRPDPHRAGAEAHRLERRPNPA